MVSVEKMTINNYWRDREKAERAWQLQQLKQDGQFNKELERYYNQAINSINKEIDAEFSRLAYRNKTSIAEAKSAVSQADMQAYADEAAKLVEEARLRRAAGHKVTYADYSDEVNERMRIYNATMRINRLELLKSRIGLQMIDAGIKVDASMQAKVADDYVAELKRQAGILGLVTESDQFWSSKEVAKQITAQVNGATFSQRIWANQDALKARLDEVISTGILRGDNPSEMARQLKQQVRDTVTNHRYVTERIARTESARAQFNAQKALIKQNGYRYVKWYAEPGACKICREIADSDRYDLGFGVYPVDEVPSIPAHPNCRCSISAHYDPRIEQAGLQSDLPMPMDLQFFNRPKPTTDIKVIQARYDHAVSQYRKETGIDVIKLMETGKFIDESNPYDDEKAKFVKWLMVRNGYNTIPTQVKDKSVKDLKPIERYYRGVHDSEIMSADELIEQLKTRPLTISGAGKGSVGRGVYLVHGLREYAERHATPDGKILTFGLKPNALRLEQREAEMLAQRMPNVLPYIKLETMDNNFEIFGILSGYDIVARGGTYNVLNPEVIEWLSDTVSAP